MYIYIPILNESNQFNYLYMTKSSSSNLPADAAHYLHIIDIR